MIIVKLMGGLGNQMFQYALGRNLSIKKKTDLFLDNTLLGNPSHTMTPRNYELGIFNIEASIAPKNLLKMVPSSRRNKIRSTFHKIFNKQPLITYIKEKTINFDNQILDLPDNVYLDGYWQSEKYFSDIRETIQKEFQIKNPPDSLNNKIIEQIIQEESISVHVRRGDYINNPKINKIHGVCNGTYYTKAFEEICNKIDQPQFFIFSDDPEWVKNHIKIRKSTVYISHNNFLKNYEDLRLMSLCKHHIMSNSSFSWWGTWLGSKKGSIIIVPNRWYNTKKCNYSDRLPTNWNVIIIRVI